ncbi:MAG TPA: M3 family metallopeptidase, partial [Ramlibacter sp.]|nr:M3 family metallopeptidase [Ramlibacter sp.]
MDPNPLLRDWTTAYGLPPFAEVAADHFEPAFDAAMKAHLAEVDAIAGNPQPPSFDNTIAALDRCGRLLGRIGMLFGNLGASHTDAQLQAVERAMAPRFAAHENAIRLDPRLFARIDQLHERRQTLGLDAESLRLLERVHLDFVLSGARLSGAQRERYARLNEELSALCTQFAQNVLADESGWLLRLQGEADLAGLPEAVRSAARTAARERGLGDDACAITLSPSLAEPFLTFSSRRDLREQVWRARTSRGAHAGEHDNRPVAARIVQLRQQVAALHGCPSYADFVLADRMAGNTRAVMDLLRRTWEPALAKAQQDRQLLVETARRLGEPSPIAAWDWRYLAEKVRQERFDLGEAAVKP